MASLTGKVLLGVLADRYGRELDGGALTIERQDGEVVVRHHDTVFPISDERLDGVQTDSVQREKDAFDSLRQRQHYRLAYWRTAQEELNYRRFFTIDTLIGLHVEDEDVLKASHRLVFDLVADGQVAGLRIDHVDGLRDPKAYLNALRSAAPDAYIVLEKVLAYEEGLRNGGAVQCTPCYDVNGRVDGV